MKREDRGRQTFVMTAMDAKELPKFIPTTVCEYGISMGVWAPPFGIWPLRAILRSCVGYSVGGWAGGYELWVNSTADAEDDDQMRSDVIGDLITLFQFTLDGHRLSTHRRGARSTKAANFFTICTS